MKRYNRFKMLNDIQDKYILESMPDYLAIQAKKRRGENSVLRFLSSGWGAACICAVVAVGVMAFIIHAGQNPWTPPGGTVEQESTEAPTIVETEVPTETPTEVPTEADTMPEFNIFDVMDLQTYQGMAPDIPYTLSYRSNGDGTCIVDGITVNILYYKGTFTIEIPETSPEGDTVIGVLVGSTYNIPAYLLAEDFEKIQAAALAYYNGDDNNFYYKQFMSYFGLYSADLAETPEQREKFISWYPLCEYIPVYVFDPTATSIEWAIRSRDLAEMAPWYTAEWCYYDIAMTRTIAESIGVTDPVLEKALAAHSGSFENVSEIKLPKTLKPRGEDLINSSPAIYLDTFSIMGIDHMTFDGTISEMTAIADPAITTVRYPLVIHCTDGDISYPINIDD